MWTLIADGVGANIAILPTYEEQVPEGGRGKITLGLHNPLDPAVAQQLLDQMVAQGIPDAEVNTYGSNVDIIYRKGFPWAAVIVALILALVVLAILIVTWRFYKEAPVATSLLLVGGILIGTAGLVWAIRRSSA